MKTIFGIGIFALGALIALRGGFYGLMVCGISIFFIYRDGSEINLQIKRYRTFIMSSDKQSSRNKLNYKYVNLRLKINYHALRNDLESKGVKRGFSL